MKSPNRQQCSPAESDNADERILRNLARNDRFGAALPLGEVARKKFIESTIAAANSLPAQEHASGGPMKLAVGLAAAAAVLFAVWWARAPVPLQSDAAVEAPPSPPVEHNDVRTAPKPIGTVLHVANNGYLDGKALSIGDALTLDTPIRVSTGNMVATPAEGIRVSFFENTRARFRRPAPSALEIHLEQGTLWAAVDPAVVNDHLTVITDLGRVEVKGTVFFVSNTTGKSEVRVLRGRVSVIDRKGIRTSLPAGKMTVLGSGESVAMDEAGIESDWTAVTALALVDGARPLEQIPLPDTETADLRRKAARRSESDLLRRIRQNRLAENWQEAADGYETLIQTYEGTESARAALISLGELRLDKFHTPKPALDLFDRYLNSGATELKREAMLGKARALGYMGKLHEEKILLRAFVAHYPTALQTPAAQARIRELDLRVP